MTIYNAYGKFETLSDIPLIKAPLPWPNVLDVSLKDLDYAEELLREVRDNATLFSKRNDHPLRGMKSGGIDLTTQELIEQHLQKLISFCEIVITQTNKFSDLFKSIDLSIFDLFGSIEVFKSLSKIDQLPSDWDKKSTKELSDKLKKIIECENVFKKTESNLEKFKAFSSGNPQDVLEIIERHLQKYPNWYSRINLRYIKDRKGFKIVLDKVTKIDDSILQDTK